MRKGKRFSKERQASEDKNKYFEAPHLPLRPSSATAEVPDG